MLINKRPTHPVLKFSEGLIERWRHDLIAGLAVDPEVAAYVLVLVACSRIQIEGKAAIQAGAPGEIEYLVRNNLFALQFGLRTIKGFPTHRKFNEEVTAGSLDSATMGKALKIHEGMRSYALARDVFLGYYFGAYDIESDNPRQLVFVDDPVWPGGFDFAETWLSVETKQARTSTDQYPPTKDVTAEFPPNVDMGSISSDTFLVLWAILAQMLVEFISTGGAPVLTRSDLVTKLCQTAQLSSNIISRFVDLITLSSTDPAELTLFHCPVVPLTRSDIQIVPPAIFGANISTTVLRLAARRGPELGAVSKRLEAFFLGRLQQHFSVGRNVIRIGRKYSCGQDQGDIDFVAYEPSSKVLTLAQAKTFIYPDSVSEVFAANEDIEEAISQLNRTRTWFNATGHEERKAVLGLPELTNDTKVLFAVLANGFVGSEFLHPPDDVLLGDIRFLLRPEFRGASLQASLQSFAVRVADLRSCIEPMVGKETIRIGEVEIVCPAIGFDIRMN